MNPYLDSFFRGQYLSSTIVQNGLVENGFKHINRQFRNKEIPCKFISSLNFLSVRTLPK